jgi:hypothetical protein
MKVILAMLAKQCVKAKNTKEVYNFIREAASVEGMKLPSYDEYKKATEEEDE